MAVSMKDLGIDRLSAEERLALMHDIWESLASDAEMPVSEAQKQVLDRRLADLDRYPDNVLTWDEIKSGIREQR